MKCSPEWNLRGVVVAAEEARLCHSELCIGRRQSWANRQPGALQTILERALNALTCHPKDEKFYRAVLHTYFQPADTQEIAAERLGLPFSTYRYHLTGGIERISEWLWNVELRGVSGARE